MTNTEIWKHIDGFPLGYEVSDLGNVRINYGDDFKLLHLTTTKAGFKQVCKDGKVLKAHILVAKAFIPNPENKPFVHHKDGDRGNNVVDNLEWVSYQENTLRALKNRQIKGNAVMCKETNKVFATVTTAAACLGIPTTCIDHSARTQTACCGYHFEYVANIKPLSEDHTEVKFITTSEINKLAETATSIEEFHKLINNC